MCYKYGLMQSYIHKRKYNKAGARERWGDGIYRQAYRSLSKFGLPNFFLHSAPFHISKTTPPYKTKVTMAITAHAIP